MIIHGRKSNLRKGAINRRKKEKIKNIKIVEEHDDRSDPKSFLILFTRKVIPLAILPKVKSRNFATPNKIYPHILLKNFFNII